MKEAGSLFENSVVNMGHLLLGVSKAVLNTDFLPRSMKVTKGKRHDEGKTIEMPATRLHTVTLGRDMFI